MHPYLTQAMAAERTRDMRLAAERARQARQASRGRWSRWGRRTRGAQADGVAAAPLTAIAPRPAP
ncbi:MAG: hypothetical protein J2P34_01195, partial [Actinobacteria bacterium]|nr:hypothetical protein [Actinomycetota bacterium]